MLKDVRWSEERAYNTDTQAEPIEFYTQALSHSTSFDLLLGYFSSAAIRVLALGFAKFISTGGQMRMVINDVLGAQDKELLINVETGKHYQLPFDISNFAELKSRLNAYDQHFFDCLGWLIQNKRIEIRVVRPKNKKGISHYKSGVFKDGEEAIGFKGSCNFTYFGLLENLEELEIFLSWENGRSNKLINNQTKRFTSIFNGETDYAELVDASEITEAIRAHFGKKDINELLVDEQRLTKDIQSAFKSAKLKKILEQSEKIIQQMLEEPRFPFSQGPREYQSTAYRNWVANNYSGIFAMATGTGKTITSLNCLLNESRKHSEKVYHGLILVPTIALVEQWETEVRKFNFQEVIKIASKYDWESDLATQLSSQKYLPSSFVVISTYASFTKLQFQKYLRQFPADTVFIADEGHNLASPSVLQKLADFPLEKRIGLSATPRRIYDPEGSTAMEQFFRDAEPYTYSFSMERAIGEGVLCRYDYYPHIVHLRDHEFAEYAEISTRLAQIYSTGQKNPEKQEIIERLLLKRKRIIHKAENKLDKAIEILSNQFVENGNLQYTFIYVPEGITTDEETATDDALPDNINIIDQYTRGIGRISERITVNKFISGLANRDEILKQFELGEIQVLASMKCLDEGVDVPRAEFAIFCSSTGNPRQFIQRRGRILRTHPDKHRATIHDLVVVPDYSNIPDESTFQVERNLMKTELERVMYFASLSENPYFTEHVFADVCTHYNLNIYTIQSELRTI